LAFPVRPSILCRERSSHVLVYMLLKMTYCTQYIAFDICSRQATDIPRGRVVLLSVFMTQLPIMQQQSSSTWIEARLLRL